jgi:hypothetical protein
MGTILADPYSPRAIETRDLTGGRQHVAVIEQVDLVDLQH